MQSAVKKIVTINLIFENILLAIEFIRILSF
jgi:hypothetical protein